MNYKQNLAAYCQSITLVWQLDSNKRGARVARYISKALLHPVASLKWALALRDSKELYHWFSLNPRLLLKPARHYISRKYNFAVRSKIIFNHYAILNNFLSPPSFEFLALGNPILLADIVGKNGGGYQILLGKTDSREGELFLQLRDTKQCREVYWFVFSFKIYEDQTGIEIGCIQGPKDKDARELVKRATKELYGIRPRNLLADALYALAKNWNLTKHSGVCNKSRIYNGDKTHADYDAFWLELGGTPGKNGMFHLPTELRHHQLSEVSSHHRAEYRRRIKLREDMSKQISIATKAIGPRSQTAEARFCLHKLPIVYKPQSIELAGSS